MRLVAIEYGKYASRVVARIEISSGEDLAAGLIAVELGRVYAGGSRMAWYEEADVADETGAEPDEPATTQ